MLPGRRMGYYSLSLFVIGFLIALGCLCVVVQRRDCDVFIVLNPLLIDVKPIEVG
mgnify:FL=1